MEGSRLRNPIAKYAGVAVIAIIMTGSAFFIKVRKESRLEYTRAEAEFQSGRQREAVVHYERTIKWYTPFSRKVHHAVNRLWDIGVQAEASHDASLALYAYRSLRAALYATRSFYQPHPDWIPKCDARIVELMAIEKAGPNAEPSEIEKHRERYARIYAREVGPTLGGSILTIIGFFGWVGATLGFIGYGLSQHGNWLLRPCMLWGSGVVIFFTAWVLGMLLA